MNPEQKWPDWVKTEADKAICHVMLNHDSASIALGWIKRYFSKPEERQKLIDGENMGAYIRYVRDLHQKTRSIMDLIAESEYAYLLNDD